MSPITRTARTGTLLFAFILLSAISFAQFDDCATPTSLTPNTTCVTTQASLFNATSSGIPGSCAGTKYDVWYTFTTPTGCTSVNIDVADVAAGGSSIDGTNTFIEVFSGANCSATTIGACTPMGTTLTLTGLSPSTNYHLRVFTTTNPTSGNSGKWDFDICVTYSPPPANDDCPGAITLPSGTSCVNTGGTLINATASGGLPVGCESAGTHYDVWYKFVATTTTHTVTISGLGANVTNPKIQLYSGSCGTLTSLACGTTSLSSASLSTLSTYYIRVSNIGSSPASNGGFNICVTNPTPPVTVVAGKMNEVYRQTIISPANALADPWEITYGPDNYLWITEAKGYKVNRINPVSGAKQVVLDVSQGSTFLPTADQTFNRQFDIAANNPQGGFAGLALHPNFTGTAGGQNYVYVSYVHTWISGVAYINRIVRFFYNTSTNRLESPVSICDTIPGSGDHNSQRMIIAPMTQGGSDYYLFYASGDMGAGQQFPTSANITRPQKAQVINSYEGKILRFALSDTCSGTGNQKWIPATNPYNDVAPIVGKSAVWCTGIRNNQGFAYNPELNILYGASHGAFSDDEINIIEGFKNYGHPLIVGYADGNYNGTTTPGLSTSISAGVPFGYTGGAFSVDGQAAAAGSCPPIGNEVTNMNNINANAVLYGTYKDPLFSAYPGPASGTGSVSTIWSAATTPGGAGWHSEAWSGLDLYTNTYIPGWKNSLLAAGLKWGRTIRLKLNATGTAVIPTAGADTATYFQSGNRYRDIAFSPNGRDIYLSMDRSPAGSAGTVGNPPATVGNCLGCVVRYEFLGYAADATALAGSTISKSIDVADGAANSISNGTTVTINAENGNTNYWVPITGPDGNIMAEIYANGNNLGTVTSSFYKNSGGIRSAPGIKYLDRNITITPQFQPTLPLGSPLVKIRLYISKTEFDALDADPLSGISSINDLRILKNDDPCSSAIIGASTLFNPINTLPADLQHGTNGYVLQTSISSFSSFYFASNNITVLPLDLLTFTGTLQTNNSVLLNWKTENEVNTSHFAIERSADGIRYGGIGNVTANGANNRGGSFSYTFTDNDAINQSSQRLYYRLRMVDIDGNFKYSKIISVSFPLITGKLSLAPNPVLTEVKVTIASEADGRVQWKLMDNVGRVLQRGSEYVRKGAGNSFTINMNRLSTGTYNLSVTGAGIDQNVKMQKL